MRSLSGFVLLAGVGVGLFVYLPAPVDRDISLDQARRHVAERAIEMRLTATAALNETSVLGRERTFSPNVPLITAARRTAPAPSVTVTTAPIAGTTQPTTSGAWNTSVGYAATGTPAYAQHTSLQPTDAAGRYQLIVELQQELRRLGCYYGRIDGSWGAGSKHAMSYFTNRVNAELPVDNPDYVLLTLLKSHNGKTCGPCPAGQSATADGRCVAQTATTATSQQALPWHTTTAQPAPSTASRPLFTPVPTTVVSTEPLPGRMAIGAPSPLPPVDAANSGSMGAGYGPYRPQDATTAALDGSALGAVDPAASAASQEEPKRRASKRSRHRDGPGTPRYNLLLSLGGVY